MESIDYLPLGSLVIVKGNVRKILVIARGLATVVGGGAHFFDYGGCLYPEGLVNDKILYFNHKDIAKVIHEGYADEDDEMMIENINDWFDKTDLVRGDPYQINQKNSRLNEIKSEKG